MDTTKTESFVYGATVYVHEITMLPSYSPAGDTMYRHELRGDDPYLTVELTTIQKLDFDKAYTVTIQENTHGLTTVNKE